MNSKKLFSMLTLVLLIILTPKLSLAQMDNLDDGKDLRIQPGPVYKNSRAISRTQPRKNYNTRKTMSPDLYRRTALGYNGQFGDGISLKYFFDNRIGIQAIGGFNMKSVKSNTSFGLNLAGKLIYNLVHKKNLLVYTGGGLGLGVIKESTPGSSNMLTINVLTMFGVEYLLPWFKDLSLGLEVTSGLKYTTNKEEMVLAIPFDSNSQTKSIFDAGVLGFHYYF